MGVASAVARAVVFTAGLFFGLLMSATAGYFGGGGGPSVVRLAVVFVPLAMGLAAVPAWVLAVKSEAGDRWTIGYLVAWLVYVGVSSLLVWIF